MVMQYASTIDDVVDPYTYMPIMKIEDLLLQSHVFMLLAGYRVYAACEVVTMLLNSEDAFLMSRH